ncbi:MULTISPECIES: diaminobutyrate acetyltransferase [Paenibacillus]|uniref:L-2,4-diaminobutyric acid acetyltransferase n=1 Tax=Paenibacillus campinasensis TaxID=66347 RepID=A0A268EEN6_9BACL|nr:MULTISPECIES: diaminobutyrate acetyltransferase [Paenibacillus]MUG67046.1 diaminobutyrate acetyltransferase [Paenibacillus campinasensis]PAD71573.1 diaminobutyrate acetyltransferase [Paenibacillus campinasensis]PAK50762.1 diaminobutyrate acetyltransferase [Paenibacillus sp. 7541]
MSIETKQAIKYRKPSAEDGSRIWKLVQDTGSLDLNSPYCYMLLGHYFNDTCLVAEDRGRMIGFISGFRPPRNPETLFVWQIAVARSHRRRGIAKAMLTELLAQDGCRGVRFIETTVSPSNIASRRLFLGFAEEKSIPSTVTVGYGADMFPEETPHDDEPLFVIGPFFNDI